ncbi:MAG: allantoinase PuuE [Magnetovibrio sp.]|nr:allantoinase PuuE [Magnetovibrio sp.]
MMMNYPRDMIGYGANPPTINWPKNARIAVQFVLNFEEGAENSILHGDAASESFLSEIVNAVPYSGARHLSIESLYEYGSRVGAWRLLNLFKEYKIPITVFAVAMAAQRNPDIIERALKDGHEIASHGFRWINYHNIPESIEREHAEKAIDILTDLCGFPPAGWYTGRTSENTRRIISGYDNFLYDSDDYSDDLPFWSQVVQKPHLVIPYTLDVNDMRFSTVQGFNCAEHFETYLTDSFDTLYREGKTKPKMMSVGLHCRIIGRPGRLPALKNFIEYILSHDAVWVCRRIDIASHWRKNHPFS